MAGRKVQTAAEALALLEGAAANGVELAVWARRHGIDGRSLNAWRINLGRASTLAGDSQELVELVPERVEGRAPLVVRCRGFAVDVGDDFDDDVLRRVLAAVAAC